jgi:hypothetical protein
VIARETSRVILAGATGRGFANQARCEVLEETAERRQAAAHDEEVGFDEAVEQVSIAIKLKGPQKSYIHKNPSPMTHV